MTNGKPASLTDIAFDTGAIAERKRILKMLDDYLELTKFDEQANGAEPNPEWDAGFGAAMALIRSQIEPSEPSECTCDPCGDHECDCRTQRCDYCKAKNE